jgi:hypothetical protein
VNEYFFVITVIIEVTVNSTPALIYLLFFAASVRVLGKYPAIVINSDGNYVPVSIYGSFHI